MASALALTLRRPGDSTGAVARRISADSTLARQVMPGMGAPGEVYFPYAFPSAGSYRIWVQVKRGGRVLTGAFDTDVR
jgi:hypothetical protein